MAKAPAHAGGVCTLSKETVTKVGEGGRGGEREREEKKRRKNIIDSGSEG